MSHHIYLRKNRILDLLTWQFMFRIADAVRSCTTYITSIVLNLCMRYSLQVLLAQQLSFRHGSFRVDRMEDIRHVQRAEEVTNELESYYIALKRW